MRYIDLESFVPSPDWQARAKQATQQLDAKTNGKERSTFFDQKASIWKELRQPLLDKFGDRCWFTDAAETVAHLDVDHFRPKGATEDENGSIREGYWWLAFDYRNFRLVGQIINRQHKRCFFPLKSGSFCATPSDRRWEEEIPLLLDPVKLTDVVLVAYAETGEMCHSTGAVTDEDKRRVEITNRLLGLSAHQVLVEARQQMWQACRRLIEQIEQLKAQEAPDRSTARTVESRLLLMRQLREKTNPSQPLSSVARCCLHASGIPWAQTLVWA